MSERAPWFHGDVVADKDTGEIIGHYFGPMIPFDQIRAIATEKTVFNISDGSVSNLREVSPDKVRHATYGDIGGGPLP